MLRHFRCRPIHLRLAVLFVVLSAAISFFFYSKYRPPYELYNTLSLSEKLASTKFLNNVPQVGARKYVFFKQIQGAGFNNQVGHCSNDASFDLSDTSFKGARDTALPSPCSCDQQSLRLPTIRLEPPTSGTALIGVSPWSNERIHQFCCFQRRLSSQCHKAYYNPRQP